MINAGNGSMGEVRVTVRLVNTSDEGLMRRGQLAAEHVRSVEVDAMVDTGCIQLAVPPWILEALGLQVMGSLCVELADGRLAELPTTEPIRVFIEDRNTAEDALVLGDEVLIGQTVLEKTDLYVDCATQRLVPNPKHPDGPVVRV